jgi:hypothetical protein
MLEDEELDAVALASTRTIDITFSASEVAGSIATGQVTSDSFRYPSQEGRGAIADLCA